MDTQSWNEWRNWYERSEATALDCERHIRDGLHDRRLRAIAVEFTVGVATVSCTIRCRFDGEWIEATAIDTSIEQAGEHAEQRVTAILRDYQERHWPTRRRRFDK